MLKLHLIKSLKFTLLVSILMLITYTAIASTTKTNVTYTAETIEPTSNKEKILLKGNVNLSINNKITILANKVAVNFKDKKQQQVAEFIIYGKGILTSDGQSMEFIDGSFDPNTLKLKSLRIIRQ